MFEHRGWVQVTTRSAATDDGHDVAVGEEVICRARHLATGSATQSTLVGSTATSRSVLAARASVGWSLKKKIDFFRWVAAVAAPGAYGLLYYCDDEDDRGEHVRNQFRVPVMARGKVTEQSDRVVCPGVPAIEDGVNVDAL